ncbi:MAG TPA: hypothetical protein VFW71_13795 [Actinomycetota bacterium]|nr:hypothetical protein [Actinomycetota bacterium]
MLVSAERPVVWGVQGGTAPASFMLLTVGAGGAARLTVASGWPRHPPFDEIGTYAWRIARDDLAELLTWRPGGGEALPAATRDSGIEYLHVWAPAEPGMPAQGVEAQWNALARPPAVEGCLRLVERLVAEGRRHPVRVLRGSLSLLADDARVAVRLSSVGAEPFAFGGDEAGSRRRAYGAAVSRADVARADALPPRLVGLEAAELDVGLALAPGEEESVALEWLDPGGGEAVAVLIEAALPLVSPSGETYLQPAWILPDPVLRAAR